MPRPIVRSAVSCAVLTLCGGALHAQTSPAPAGAASAPVQTLEKVVVRASADASAEGLSPSYAGGQVARGGRAGILGTRDHMETPFSITSYTNELIQDRQAKSVGDVLQNDPSVRVARGFGNFQESYFIRGFVVGSDDVAYNGLYSLLPRQYIATELFERVEVLRGASAFLMGASPGGGLGGTINLLPKRAPNEPLTRVTAGIGSGSHVNVAADVARRFGPDENTGIRINAAARDGGSAVDDEDSRLGLLAVGLDWRSRDVRLSGDLGWQDNRLKRTRPSVDLTASVTAVPTVPDHESNYAQPWTFSNEKDLFGTLRGEFDLSEDITAWAAYGIRRSEEYNLLGGLDLTDAATGAATTYRFENAREDEVNTGELGLRGKLRTGSVGHEWVVSASHFALDTKNGYAMDFTNLLNTNLYAPTLHPLPPFGASPYIGNSLAAPQLSTRTRLNSVAVGDTLSLLNDRVLVTLGARHQKIVVKNIAPRVDFGGTVTPGGATTTYDKSHTSPVLGVVYKAGEQWSVYGNYIEGLSQGETAGSANVNVGEMLAPYVSKQKEVGLKFDHGRLGGSLAFFTTSKPRAITNAANVFTAEGEDRHRGIELSFFGEAIRGLRLLGGLTWLDAEQQSTGSPALDGKRVIGVPRVQANIGAEWDVPALRGLALDARVVSTGSSYADAANTLKVPGWTRVDVGARYFSDWGGRMVTWRARVDNLADRGYWASVGGNPGFGYLTVSAPRTVSLSASLDF